MKYEKNINFHAESENHNKSDLIKQKTQIEKNKSII